MAAGEELPYEEADLLTRGWAIECRIVAEDPFNGFLPSVGRVVLAREPAGPGIRVESALYDGVEVTPYYDSLLAKVTAWGRNREGARQRMKRALAEFKVVGVATNIPYLRADPGPPRFHRGRDRYRVPGPAPGARGGGCRRAAEARRDCVPPPGGLRRARRKRPHYQRARPGGGGEPSGWPVAPPDDRPERRRRDGPMAEKYLVRGEESAATYEIEHDETGVRVRSEGSDEWVRAELQRVGDSKLYLLMIATGRSNCTWSAAAGARSRLSAATRWTSTLSAGVPSQQRVPPSRWPRARSASSPR